MSFGLKPWISISNYSEFRCNLCLSGVKSILYAAYYIRTPFIKKNDFRPNYGYIQYVTYTKCSDVRSAQFPCSRNPSICFGLSHRLGGNYDMPKEWFSRSIKFSAIHNWYFRFHFTPMMDSIPIFTVSLR